MDTGSSYNIVAESFVKKHKIKTCAVSAATVTVGDGRRCTGCPTLKNEKTKLKMDSFKDAVHLRVFPIHNYDVLPRLGPGRKLSLLVLL